MKDLFLLKFLITVCTLVYCVGVPILEINNTHVFSPEWSPHARIHEVWQLLTNSTFGFVALFLLWCKGQVRYSAMIGIIITGSFLMAYALRNLYGGSMVYLDGSEKIIFGINIGLFGFGLVLAVLLAVLFRLKVTSE